MKKLMFAAALAASAAAFADGPINATAFANPGEYNPNEASSYFYFAGETNAVRSSVVTNEPAGSIHTKHTANFASATDANYLALDTEGGTLWRSINTLTPKTVGEDTTYDLGAVTNVAATGTYLDTLVQFTVTEDEAPTVGADDKLAIWLQAGEGTTNLMVHAGWTVDGSLTEDGTNFVLSGVSIIPGEWYRLTVKAYDDILIENEELKFPAFSIFIDGTEVGTGNFTIDSTFAASLSQLYKPGMASKVEAGTVFLSCVAGEPSVTTTLQGVGFQGTGAVDAIVWTEQDLFPAGGVEFTLTYTAGDANVTLGAVTYTIDGGEAQTPTEGKIPDGAEVSIAAPTFAEGYQLGSLTTNSVEVASPTFPFVFTMTADTTVEITAAQTTYTLTVPSVANATLTSPASLTGIAPGTEVTLTWTAADGYTFNGSKTMTKTVTVNSDMTIDVNDVESSLSKEAITVTVTDIANATIAAKTNNTDLVDALSENTTTNQYTVEYGATVTVTATAAQGYEYATAPEGWTLNAGVLSIETNVTAAVELAAPAPTAVAYTLTVTGDANATYVVTINGNDAATGASIVIGNEIVVTATANPGYNYTETPEGWTAGAGVITKTITVETADVEVTIPAPAADAPSSIEIEPGAQGATTYTTEADAAAVTNNVTVAVPAAVTAAGVDATAYKANFEPKVVSDGDGGYKIEIGLTAAAEADLQTQANNDAGALVSDITASTVTITTTPGFYYSVKYGSSLNAMNAQTASVLADGSTESITLPAKSGTSGFYKVVISIVPNEAVTP